MVVVVGTVVVVVVVVVGVVVVVVVVVVDVVVVSLDDEHDATMIAKANTRSVLEAMAADSIRSARERCRRTTVRSRRPPTTMPR